MHSARAQLLSHLAYLILVALNMARFNRRETAKQSSLEEVARTFGSVHVATEAGRQVAQFRARPGRAPVAVVLDINRRGRRVVPRRKKRHKNSNSSRGQNAVRPDNLRASPGSAVTCILSGQSSVRNEPHAPHARLARQRSDDLTADEVTPFFAVDVHSDVDVRNAIAPRESFELVASAHRVNTSEDVVDLFQVVESEVPQAIVFDDFRFGADRRYARADNIDLARFCLRFGVGQPDHAVAVGAFRKVTVDKDELTDANMR